MSIDFIHHVGVIPLALDLDAVSAQYQRLGFGLTPVSRIEASVDGTPPYIGLSDRTAIFGTSYLELVGATDPEIWANVPPKGRGAFNIDERLADHAGAHIFVFGTHDIDACRETLTKKGRIVSPVARLQRQVESEQGPATMRAQVMFFAEPPEPYAIVSVAQHDTPELVLQPRYQSHPNGVRDIAELIFASTDPEASARRHAARIGHAAIAGGHGFHVDLPRGRLSFVDPAELARRNWLVPTEMSGLVALRFAVASLPDTAAYLAEAKIDFIAGDDALIVGMQDAAGVVLVFSEG